MDLQLTGRHAFLAASTGGLGLAIGKALADEGAKVTLSGRREEEAAKQAATLGSGAGVHLDLSDPDSPAKAMSEAESQLGPIDILVFNSGGPKPSAGVDLTPEDLAAASEVMLLPLQRMLNVALPGMRERGWGRVVVVGSSGIREPIEHLAVSNVLRAAQAGLLKTISREVAADGVTVNMVLPGRIHTPRIDQLDAAKAQREGTTPEAVRAASEASIPAGRYGTQAEFAQVASFLCSEQASYVTGSQIRVDGGMARGF